MKYIISSLLLLASFTAVAEKKPKCPGKLKLKVGETFYDRGTRTNYKCDCKAGTGATEGTTATTTPCEPTLYERRFSNTAEKQADWTVVEKPE